MKKLSALGISTAAYLTLAMPAFAAINPCPQSGSAGGIGLFRLCNITPDGTLVSTLITVAFVIAILIALGFLIFGGIKWITSGGDKAGVESARNTIVAALVGLVIVFLAFLIIQALLTVFGLGNIQNLTLPKIS